jgi:hypothetical protein
MTHNRGIIGIFRQNRLFLKRFGSLGGQSPSVGSSWGYLQNGWQFGGLNCNFPLQLRLYFLYLLELDLL